MSQTAQEIARDARAAYRAKYGDEMDVVDAHNVLEMIVSNAPLPPKDRERAIDALNYMTLAWNVEIEEDASAKTL